MIDAYAVVFPAANEAELQTIGLPDPEPEDVVVETEFSGISIGTEGWIFTAAYYQTKFPLVTGYQKVGRITAMGDAVKDYAVGDRVFLRSTKIASGPPSMWGGHTSRSVANLRELIPVPEAACPACASLLVLVAVGYHGAAELCDVQPGDLTVIIGQGLIGQFAAQVCKQRGCTVVTCEPLAKRRELLEGARRGLRDRPDGAGPVGGHLQHQARGRRCDRGLLGQLEGGQPVVQLAEKPRVEVLLPGVLPG